MDPVQGGISVASEVPKRSVALILLKGIVPLRLVDGLIASQPGQPTLPIFDQKSLFPRNKKVPAWKG